MGRIFYLFFSAELSPVFRRFKQQHPHMPRNATAASTSQCWKSQRLPVHMLVGVVAGSGSRSRQTAIDNMLAMQEFKSIAKVQWVFFAYDDLPGNWGNARDAAEHLSVSMRVVAGSDVVPDPRNNSSICGPETASLLRKQLCEAHRNMLPKTAMKKPRYRPKTTFLRFLVRWIQPQHDLVWAVDEDIHFTGFRLDTYLYRRSCAFQGSTPLLSQPTIQKHPESAEGVSPQGFWLMNHHDLSQLGLDVEVVPSLYVEQQVAVYSAGFFKYLMSQGKVQHMIDTQDIYGTDWGLGWVACKYAATYATDSRIHITCAIITVPVYHRSQQTTPKRSTEFHSASQYLVQLVHKEWPADHIAMPAQLSLAAKDMTIQRCYLKGVAGMGRSRFFFSYEQHVEGRQPQRIQACEQVQCGISGPYPAFKSCFEKHAEPAAANICDTAK